MVRKPFSITNDPWPSTFWPKINRAHSWLMGSKRMKFHDHRWIIGSVPETIFNHHCPMNLDLWPQNQKSTSLTQGGHVYEVSWSYVDYRVSYSQETIYNLSCTMTFDLKINRAHPWFFGSKCTKFHDHRLITEPVIVRKPFIIDHAPWSWPFTFWPQNQECILGSWGVSVWRFVIIDWLQSQL